MEMTKLLLMSNLALALTGCGGSGGDSSSSSSTPTQVSNASPGGIWRGTESSSGLQVLGLIDESGEFHFIRPTDGVQYIGHTSTSGNSVSADFEGFTPYGFQFADKSTHGTGSASGTVAERSTMNLSAQFKTDAGTTTNGTLNLTFDASYNRPSSLATIAGNFADGSNTITVSSNGTIFEQDPNTGCVVNGTVSIINASYNAYRVSYSFANCTGQATILNGLEFNGLGTLDNTQSPEHAVVGVTATSGSTKIALVLNVPRV